MQEKSKTVWPDGAKYCLFLSHDIDQIHDRELFHVLASCNHVRRMLLSGEPGNISGAWQRMIRSLFCPKNPLKDFETIHQIEQKYGFVSTWYILDDPYWHRHGSRYKLNDPALFKIVEKIKPWGGEIGLHGGVSRFNDADGYAVCKKRLEQQFGVEVRGIRNHLLKFDGMATWRAQSEAGFYYDATFGYRKKIGHKASSPFPFFPVDHYGNELPILEIPLAVMDGALFRGLRLSGEEALECAWTCVKEIIDRGGLVSLLWHNNFFNDKEYHDWQWVYERLLDRCAEYEPWCATGRQIDDWWRGCRAGI